MLRQAVHHVIRTTIAIALLNIAAAVPAQALTINIFNGWSTGIGLRSMLGPQHQYFAPPAQQADLLNIMEAAASIWEGAINDPGFMNIGVGYFSGGMPAGVLGVAFPSSSFPGIGFIGMASPVREPNWFIDPTPLDNSEYSTETYSFAELGGGLLNTGVVYGGGPFAYDMLSVALHEIGHVLAGLLTPGIFDLMIESPLLYAGTLLPYNNAHIMLPNSLMYPFGNVERQLISDADVLFIAQGRGFTDVNLRFEPVPEPMTLLLLGTGLVGVASRARFGNRTSK